ncbi:AMP-binding protein [Chitinivibrio alkaliphilus]|uniref:2-acyl-glycerophospho-ethanolamine acyltransferase n=1 Tax=Chitinivibrio alkaliphilus ACht1 TaxID=1313304 RepID=U7DB62_9BACT|nr:AMP-binding protein [Chitinivibrio alkaliphilus]ERP38783.1 2-acyl-glycerophospho-ethanolamine acyltransferase [Chitinivibrio alkaliphilus ACht1]
MKTLHEVFIETARQKKDALAVYDRGTNQEYTYDRLLTASCIFSDRIRHSTQDSFVGILMPSSAGGIIATLAVLMAGKIPVMLNYSTGVARNCTYAREVCGFTTIISSRTLLQKLDEEPLEGMLFVEDIVKSVTSTQKVVGVIKKKFAGFFSASSKPDDTACILFTSGSEKEPKAVQLSHRNILSNIADITQCFEIRQEDVFMSLLPYFHVYGLTTNFWLPLLHGCHLVAEPNPLAYRSIVQDISAYGATVIAATPTFFMGYARQAEKDSFSTVRVAMSGGDSLSTALMKEYQERFGLTLLEGYGTTETSPVISVNTLEEHKAGSIGKPLPSVEVKIVDIDTHEECPPGKQGKILVRGDLVMKGYYNNYEETALRIHQGWYNTGDLGVLDKEGFLWHKGRLKRFVKIGAEMVSLVSVEHALSTLLPEEGACCVVDIPDRKKGARIVAAVTEVVNDKKIRRQLRHTLPAIAVPSEFVFMEELPLMASGKVNFREVQRLCRDIFQV